jgi:hypothetical protein
MGKKGLDPLKKDLLIAGVFLSCPFFQSAQGGGIIPESRLEPVFLYLRILGIGSVSKEEGVVDRVFSVPFVSGISERGVLDLFLQAGDPFLFELNSFFRGSSIFVEGS